MAVQRVKIESAEQWHALRANDVTASVVAALFGVHPYQTLAGVVAEKTGLIERNIEDSSVMRRGRALERIVGEEVGRLRPDWEIIKADEYLTDPRLRLGCTPDFYVVDHKTGKRGVLQTKTVASSVFRKSWDEESAPFWITLQTQTEMMMDGADFGAIGALVVGDFVFDAYVYDIPRHVASQKRLVEAVGKFWADIDAGIAPIIDFERDGPLVELLYPEAAPGKVIDLTGDNLMIEALTQRERLRAEIKAAETECDRYETEIKAKMGDAEAAIVPGWRPTWKTQNRKEFTVKASSFRVLRTPREAEKKT